MTRTATNRLLEMVDEGLLDALAVLKSCLSYMSEDDVADMAHCEGFFDNDSESDDESEEDE